MKRSIQLCILIAGILFSSVARGQYMNFGASKVILKSGDVKTLKGETELMLSYDYSNMKVGAFNSEDEYVNSKVKEYNAKEKGKGDKWKQGWIGARKERYQPKFEALFNKGMKKKGIVASETSSSAKYTLIVKTTFIEIGFNVGIAKKPAFCNYEFLIVETSNPSSVVAELYLNNVIGSSSMGYDFDTGSRVQESYAKAGKMLAKFIVKNMK